ncbi:MAG: GNAT family N-acetyltransferase [Bifidobacterium sp.]|nr:GNAT family N-acetyltransferase [Bifidobacterium sp.]
MTVQIREADENDVEAVREVSVATFRETFAASNSEEDMALYIERDLNPDTLRAQIDDPESRYLLASVDGKPAGVLKVNVGAAQTETMGDDALEVQRIYVLREYKGHGVGSALMARAFDLARRLGKRRVWLGVWEHNDAAYRFYLHKGFRKVGEHTFMLGDDPQTDWIMAKNA